MCKRHIYRKLGIIWHKKYRPLLFWAAVVGIGLFWYWQAKGVLAPSEAITIAVLWLTGVTIFWYTRETFDLKRISNKHLLENRRQVEFMKRPFLRLKWKQKMEVVHAVDYSGMMVASLYKYFTDIEIVNDGRGLAIEIKPLSVIASSSPEERGVPVEINEIDALRGEGGAAQIRYADIQNGGELDGPSEKRPLRQGISIKLSYCDLEGDSYYVDFESDPAIADGFRIVRQGKCPA